MIPGPDRIQPLTDALLAAPDAAQRDRSLLEAAVELCGASFVELWRRVETADGVEWWPVRSCGDPLASPARALVRESLGGRFGESLPGRGHVLRDEDLALVLGEVGADGAELDVLEGLLIVRAALDLPIADPLEAPVAPAPRPLAAGAHFSVQATRALLEPGTRLEIEGELEGAELGVDPDALAALLLDLRSTLRSGGAASALRVGTRDAAGRPLLELRAELNDPSEGGATFRGELLERARRHGFDAESVDHDGGTTITLRLPIVLPDAA